MPNVVAHANVAQIVNPEESPKYVLGSVWSDLAGIYEDATGLTPILGEIDPELASGMELHTKTDKLYKVQPERAHSTSLINKELEAIGLPRLEARSAATLITDLALDSILLSRSASLSAYSALSHHTLKPSGEIKQLDIDSDFRKFIEDYFISRRVMHYGDALFVANIIQERLTNRAKRQGRADIFNQDITTNIAAVVEARSVKIGNLMVSALDRTIHVLRFSI